MFTGVVCIYCSVPFPVLACNVFKKLNIKGANRTRNGRKSRRGDEFIFSLLLHWPTSCSLTVKYPYDSIQLIQVPYLQKTADDQGHARLKRTNQKNYFQIVVNSLTFNYLFPSMTGSLNKQSLVGRPACRALRTDPSGNTSFLRILKS